MRNLTDTEELQQWFIKYVVSRNRGSTPQHPPFFVSKDTVKSAWQIAIDAAEEHSDPGWFTGFADAFFQAASS